MLVSLISKHTEQEEVVLDQIREMDLAKFTNDHSVANYHQSIKFCPCRRKSRLSDYTCPHRHCPIQGQGGQAGALNQDSHVHVTSVSLTGQTWVDSCKPLTSCMVSPEPTETFLSRYLKFQHCSYSCVHNNNNDQH